MNTHLLELMRNMLVTNLNTDALRVSAMLEDKLFQVEERTLVVNSLPDLHHGGPSIVCKRSRAGITLLIPHDECNDHCLLQHCAISHFLLHC